MIWFPSQLAGAVRRKNRISSNNRTDSFVVATSPRGTSFALAMVLWYLQEIFGIRSRGVFFLVKKTVFQILEKENNKNVAEARNENEKQETRNGKFRESDGDCHKNVYQLISVQITMTTNSLPMV